MVLTLILSAVFLFFLALKSSNKVWFEILRFLFGMVFLAAYYQRLDPSGANASNHYNILRVDVFTLFLSYLYFLVLYLSSFWIMIFKRSRWLLYLPLALFGIIHFWNFFIMDGIAHFQLVFLEVFVPSAIAFLPLHCALYLKFIKVNNSNAAL